MYIYNVTTKLDWSIHEEWVNWMLEQHIPDVMSKACFTDYKFVRLLETDEAEGPTYAIQYHAADKNSYEQYLSQHAPLLRKEAMDKWGNRFISFRSLMEVVH